MIENASAPGAGGRRGAAPGDGSAGVRDDEPWFRAAIFDLDGLLVDSEPLWRLAEIEIFGRYGVPLTDDLCRTTKGRVILEVAQHWHRHFGWSGPPPAAVADEVVDRVAFLLADRVSLKPGARRALAWCRARGLRLAVASSSGHRLIEAAVARHHLRRLFDAVCSADDVAAGKPDPAVLLAAARALAVAPARCVVLEDSVLGARAAAAAGMACVLVPEAGDPVRGAGTDDGDPAGAVVVVPAGGGAASGGPPVTVDAVLASLQQLPAAWPLVTARARRRAGGEPAGPAAP